jgi:hypothetical protein
MQFATAWQQPPLPVSPSERIVISEPQRNATGQNGMRPYYTRMLNGYAVRFSPPTLNGPPRAWCNCDDCVDHPNPSAWTHPSLGFPPFCSPTSPVTSTTACG